MKKGWDYIIILLLLTAFLVASFTRLTLRETQNEKIFTLTMIIVYKNNDGVTVWNLTESDRAVGLFMNNSWQTVYLVETSHPIESFYEDEDGNKIALIKLSNTSIEPGGEMHFEVTYRLIYKPRSIPKVSGKESGTLSDIPGNLKADYATLTSLWQTNISALKQNANEIAGNETKVLSIIEKFVRWIKEKIRYPDPYKPLETPQYPNETLSSGVGDCDDQANLLITLCRIVGIPAYLQVGCIYIQDYTRNFTYWSGRLTVTQDRVGWHGWAMVYVPPWGWLPVDLTYVRGSLIAEPLNSITTAAVIEHPTFQYMNITKTDYVAEAREAKAFFETREFYIHEEDIMMEIGSEEITGKPFLFMHEHTISMSTTFISNSHTVFHVHAPRMNKNPA